MKGATRIKGLAFLAFSFGEEFEAAEAEDDEEEGAEGGEPFAEGAEEAAGFPPSCTRGAF